MGTKRYMPSILYLVCVLSLFSSVKGQCSASGISLSGTSGNITSPNYPSNYPNSETCRWTITVPSGHVVRLNFQSFHLESCLVSSPTCSCDHLEIRDGTSGSAELLGRFCGSENPSAVQSSGRSMWIEFDSDFSDNEPGFFVTYTAVDASECPNNGMLSGANGSFTSPGFPMTYPVSVKCTWIIEVPVDHHVQLTFTTFQLETCAISSICTCDHVEVRDGQLASSDKLRTLCGDEKPPSLRSSGRYMWVEFDSDSKTARSGFNASFKAVPASECPTNGILSGANGSFTSPGFPLTYPVSVKCTWIIEVPEDYHVQLKFITFQLENCAVPSICSCDHVQVRNGRVGNAEELRELCGDNIPATLRLRSSGRYMWVEFDSDSKTVGNGFDAFFKAVPASECPINGILSGANGSFTSPGFPLTYPVSVKCTWIIEVPEDYHVQLTFTTFQLENCAVPSICSCDHVQVRNGRDGNAEELRELCGDNIPATLRLRSSGRYMWVEFDSDSKTVGNGFDAFFKAVHQSECPTDGVLRGSNGSFTSPGFPLGYPHSVTCSWIIEVPENHHVELTFNTFKLENCLVPTVCSCDHVQVRDGRTAKSSELKTLCGDTKPLKILSSGQYLWVEFDSDSRTTSSGFNASFKAIAANECPQNLVLKGTNGSFTSPGYPSNYPNDVTCTWIIEAPENHFLELTFESFELEPCFISSSAVCSCDHVEVRDGKDGKSEKLERFCGDSEPSSLTSTGQYLWVEFESDSRTTRKGFKAMFKAKKFLFFCEAWFGLDVSKGACIGITAVVFVVVVALISISCYFCCKHICFSPVGVV